MSMDFDIVIVTRNRQKALPISIPLMLAQSRLPQKFIVIDSSDNHNDVRRIVENIFSCSMANVRLEIHRTSPGISYQRNVGLKYAESPVVFFPDDDALWFPNVAENMMKVYERDSEGLIGAVCAAESIVPPPGVFDNAAPLYRMEFRDRLQRVTGRFVDPIENKFFQDPLFIEGYSRSNEKLAPLWLDDEGAESCGQMTGFRMSFRTELIRNIRFDEILGRYALFEDRDASLGILHNYLIICAKTAKVFHYRSPEKRTNGLDWGVMHILNRVYVVCKHSSPGSLARRRLIGYSCYKMLRYLLQAQTPYGRQRVLGAWRAIRQIPKLLGASREELPGNYLKARNVCLGVERE